MAMFDDLAAQYTALPSWAQIGIPVAGLGGIAYIALHKGSGGTAVVSGPGVSAGASNGGGGGNSSSGGSAPPISSDPGGGGTPQSQPGPTAPPINFTGPPSTLPGVNYFGDYSSLIAPLTTANPNASQAAVASAAAELTYAPTFSKSIASWGSAQNLSQPSNDTYVLAQQYYYALQNPAAATGTMFANAAQDKSQLAQLTGQITGQGAAYWGAYPTIPSNVLSAGGNLTTSSTAVMQAATIASNSYVATPTTGGTSASQPGNTNYSAANATLYKNIQIYQNVANPTAKQKAALATDLATYRRQGGVLP